MRFVGTGGAKVYKDPVIARGNPAKTSTKRSSAVQQSSSVSSEEYFVLTKRTSALAKSELRLWRRRTSPLTKTELRLALRCYDEV